MFLDIARHQVAEISWDFCSCHSFTIARLCCQRLFLYLIQFEHIMQRWVQLKHQVLMNGMRCAGIMGERSPAVISEPGLPSDVMTLGIWPLPGKLFPKDFAMFTVQKGMLHPRKQTNLKKDYFSRKCIFQPLILRGHVAFQGSSWDFLFYSIILVSCSFPAYASTFPMEPTTGRYTMTVGDCPFSGEGFEYHPKWCLTMLNHHA